MYDVSRIYVTMLSVSQTRAAQMLVTEIDMHSSTTTQGPHLQCLRLSITTIHYYDTDSEAKSSEMGRLPNTKTLHILDPKFCFGINWDGKLTSFLEHVEFQY